MNGSELSCAAEQARLTPFHTFLAGMGRTSVTGWRWRRRGWINTVSIAGRLYVTQAELQRFSERAQRGEFTSVNGGRGA